MARDRRLRGEDSRKAAPVPGQTRVPDRVDAAVNAMEAPGGNGLRNRLPRIPKPPELLRRDHPILALGQFGESSMPFRSSLVNHR
jgi:hypothetical protein